ncbi:hypothetical protein DSO57_1034645 [Entomophthora muscae]|uniref:Uncharacterized protein n=1 Tax=Entomophthora muscae TaxID=34485 RepID=A0ACC2TMX7_9FUNG|nr:hypothetical protein DSO57_1034645 [Entomophthora muscae]
MYPLFLILVFVNGLRMPDDPLFLKQQALDKFRFSIRPELPRGLGPVTTVVSPGGKFIFEVRSHDTIKKVDRFKSTLQITAGYFENAFSFARPITIQVDYGSYCSDSDCTARSPYNHGECVPWFKEIYSSTGDVVLWPYALVHQKEPRVSKEFDMKMYIDNSDIYMYPEELGDYSILKYDISAVILHEMIHGLGITSYVSMYTGNPKYLVSSARIAYHRTSVTISYVKTLYDTFLHLNHSTKDFPKRLYSVPGYEDISPLLSTRCSTYFLTKSNKKFYTGYLSPNIADFSHLDRGCFKVEPEYSLTAPIEEMYLDILVTLGYQLNPNPSMEKSLFGLLDAMKPFIPDKRNTSN